VQIEPALIDGVANAGAELCPGCAAARQDWPVDLFDVDAAVDRLDAGSQLRGEGTATIQAYVDRITLVLGKRATMVPDVDGSVYGTIMRLSHADVGELYSETSVCAYLPEPVLAQMADCSAELALCLNLPTPPDGSEGNPQYAAALQAAARKIGLPEDSVALISTE